MNEALLSKWLWRYGVECQALWRQVVKAKYGEGDMDWFPNIPTGPMGCSVWKGISGGLEEFLLYTSFKVNKGNRVRFWMDTWCTREPLGNLNPSCFQLA